MEKELTRQERGWAGHFIGADNCMFKRNTLLSYNNIKIVISTVGLYVVDKKITAIGSDNRYFETMAFHSNPKDVRYNDADVSQQISFESNWAILDEKDADDKANKMHEDVVTEITNRLLIGEQFNKQNEKQTVLEFYRSNLMALVSTGKTDFKTEPEIFEQAKEMHKQETENAFVECWKANMPDGYECKLSAEQYYNETFGK
jgi:preprotein translocase subunit SecA